jgi:hypothetical protein
MDLRHRRLLRTVRLGHRDGGTPIQRAAGTGGEALSEIRSPWGQQLKEAVMFTIKLAAVGLFLVVATFMWLPPALHAAVTAALVLLVLVASIARRWFTNA